MRSLLMLLLFAGCTRPMPSGSLDPSDPYTLVLESAGCWLGPQWDEAQSDGFAVQMQSTERHCRWVVQRTFGAIDPIVVDRFRVAEPVTTRQVADKLRRLSRRLPGELDQMFLALATAQRDNVAARRVLDGTTRHLTERTFYEALSKVEGIRTLLDLQVGPYTHDAHALGVLSASERIEIVRTLSPRPRGIALQQLYRLLFNRAVPKSLATVAEGIADKMRQDEVVVTPLLRPVLTGYAEHVESEYHFGSKNKP